MTARPLRIGWRQSAGLRVIQGRRLHRPIVSPWMAFTVVVVVAFLGIVMARTALDRGAFVLAELDAQIAQAQTTHQRLILEVARLESPARVGPLAEEMGLVYPEERRPLLVEGVVGPQPTDDPRWSGLGELAAADPATLAPVDGGDPSP